MRSKHVYSLVFSAMLASLVFVATWIMIPAPIGNVNLGDAVLLLGAWTLGGPWATVACALGAALTDLASGYAIYAPATLLIKALMVIVAILLHRLLSKRLPRVSLLISAIAAEVVMVLGYFLYEGIFLYGFPAALIAIPFNCIQGGVCITVAFTLSFVLKKAPLFKK